MREIAFEVSGQHIEIVNQPVTVSGTKNYLYARFRFDGTWNGFKKVAIFNDKWFAEIQKGICKIPDEAAALKVFSVKVAGKLGGTMILTDFAMVKQR